MPRTRQQQAQASLGQTEHQTPPYRWAYTNFVVAECPAHVKSAQKQALVAKLGNQDFQLCCFAALGQKTATAGGRSCFLWPRTHD